MTTKHECEGYNLTEEHDLWGRICAYGVEGTRWRIVRLERGWRANGGRSYAGPYRESAPAVLRYLIKYGRLSNTVS